MYENVTKGTIGSNMIDLKMNGIEEMTIVIIEMIIDTIDNESIGNVLMIGDVSTKIGGGKMKKDGKMMNEDERLTNGEEKMILEEGNRMIEEGTMGINGERWTTGDGTMIGVEKMTIDEKNTKIDHGWDEEAGREVRHEKIGIEKIQDLGKKIGKILL